MWAYVEVRDARRMKSGRIQIDHKWGSTILYTSPGQIDITVERLPTVRVRYEQKLKDVTRGGKPTERQFEDLAEWCLAHGMLDEFARNMDQLGDLAPGNKAFLAYKAVKTAIDRPVPTGDLSDVHKKLGSRFKAPRESPHYVLLYDAKEERPDISTRLTRLEDTFKAFFYWFALKGVVLQLPDHRLVAVLTDSPDYFKELRRRFDSGPLVADGFYARRENVAVFSSRRLDLAYDALSKVTKDMWERGWDPEKLLSRDPQDARKAHPRGASGEEIAYAQTVALLTKALQEESEVASVTHEGTRQLLAAASLKPGTVLLPRGVAAPEWVQFGVGSFFETPEGAPWMGTGAPSWTYLVAFDVLQTGEKLDKAEDAIKMVITDKYFQESNHGRHRGALLNARTMSWSLTYYLARKHTDGLIRYFQELENLPRDLEFDDDVLLGCFGRAFGLMQDPKHIDEGKLAELAKDWYQTIKDTPLEINEARKDAIKAEQERYNKRRGGGGGVPKPPAGPAGPGGVGVPIKGGVQ
jgi:hypothetical protein